MMIWSETLLVHDAGAPRASGERWPGKMLTTSARGLAVLATKTLRMSTLLTVSQASLAVPRICIEGGFLDETAATRKQGSPGKRPGFTKRFIGIVVTDRRDNRQARRPKSL
ncbi:hypothetical protein SAMN05216338_1009110 [Bradyrhizobium sp. Rc2d]|uniref:hypothetical protein n=1 Tax=Bradyrhizobium sp. Rc2d TaxID=1855321 RepID=UPI0008878BE9|nr:hypothetical protein [Bradyrhizobium sp. Rc2d]SDH44691.1 hypothetical protein SAMN05216338_1009110 [Bradyrhizobium sp. Rc2d]